ncbi:thiazole synthase [Phaeobacter sp.]|uniref:thiazole synthase n=1 Tax=Phaeobacter sp. TaxID=1902409 RepID=UPI0025DCC231|nr:thiazole synthase [Phaeobacter sp.]
MRLYDTDIRSRLLLGTAQYPSPAVLTDAIRQSGSQIITVSLRRETTDGSGAGFWSQLRDLDCLILPNTAGCHTVKEAVTTAHMARDLFDTRWIKLEVIGHSDLLQPDVFALVEAARILTEDGFQVFPYTTDDIVVGERLLQAGCEVLMPWGAPIGSGQGLRTPDALRAMRAHFPDTPLIVDAGIGRPSDATKAMELGMDAVLLNTAVAKAGDPAKMAHAMALAIVAGRQGYEADPMDPRDLAVPSTPVLGLADLN